MVMGLGNDFERTGAALNRKGRRFMRRFLAKRDGGVAMIFAIAFVPLLVLTLTAIDFHRASTVKGALQDALDSAALAAARSQTTDPNELRRIGQRVLDVNMQAFPDVTLTAKNFLLRADGTVEAKATATVKPMVANMFIGHDLGVSVDTEVVRANDKLEIVLVLDNTGSMEENNKIGTLRTAATDLVNNLFEAAKVNPEPDAIKVGLVPFSMTVRVDSSYQNANWIDGSNRSSLHGQVFDNGAGNRFSALQRMKIGWAGCVESRPYPFDVQETAPSHSNSETLFVPYFAPDEPDVHAWRSNNRWKSLGKSDVQNDYLPDAVKSSDAGNWMARLLNGNKYGTSGLNTSGGRGPNWGCTLQTVERLTTDPTDIKTAISKMTPSGNTNIPMGLVWGWHVLTPLAPFGDGAPYTDKDVTKIAILMTDGTNVMNTSDNPNDSNYSGLGYVWAKRLGNSIDVGSSESARRNVMNARLTELCTNMKAKKIVIYTIGFDVPDASTLTLLKGCATENANFYDAKNAADLTKAFENIAAQISRLRISK